MCTNPKTVRVEERFPHRLAFHGKYQLTVPCGHCAECLKKKQNDFMIRFYREARRSSSVAFLTLTYSNNTIPIAFNRFTLSKTSGELKLGRCKVYSSRDKDYNLVRSCEHVQLALLQYRLNKPHYHVSYYSEDEDVVVSPVFSLCRKDVQLWLKNCRVAYEREFEQKLPEFKYTCIGEYGSSRHRPHYHMVFFGLDYHIIKWFAKRWKDQYGFTYFEPCKAVSDDGSNGYLKLSRYLSKYISKGPFEFECVGCGECEKPRRCQSLQFGSSLSEREISHYLAYDLYGKYNIETLYLYPEKRKLTQNEQSCIVSTIMARLHIPLPGKDGKVFNYSLPRILNYKLFSHSYYVREKEDGLLSFRYKWSSLHYLVAQAQRDKYYALSVAELRQYISSRTDVSLHQAVEDYSSYRRVLEKKANEVQFEAIAKSYLLSKDGQ